MQRHQVRNWSLAALTLALLALAVAVVQDLRAGRAGASAADPVISANVASTASGAPMPPGFVGVSLEYSALHVYEGRNTDAVDPVLVGLLRGLTPGAQSPVLRIGGDSADATWWPVPGMVPPQGIRYSLTPGWMETTRALAHATASQLILGVNLAAGRPALASAEARALLDGLGSANVQALEIGNEPDVYALFPWYHGPHGRAYYSRPRDWSLSDFIAQFSRWRAALPAFPLAGPAFAELGWLSGLGQFIASEPGLRVLTLHRYPLRSCVGPSNAAYPTIPRLLDDTSSTTLAQSVAPYVSLAHSQGLGFRVDEMQSASCSGKAGVSDTFASALWVLDTLFNLAHVGVDGVNVHSLPHAAYELFTFTHPAGAAWEAFVHPEYYGMLLFAQAFPPGAQMLNVDVSPSGPLKVWATRDRSFHTRVVVINKDPSTSYQVQLQVPGFSNVAQLEWLQAPSVSSTGGVTLGGQSFGDQTTTGTLPPPQTQPVVPILGRYTIDVPPASAALLTQ